MVACMIVFVDLLLWLRGFWICRFGWPGCGFVRLRGGFCWLGSCGLVALI